MHGIISLPVVGLATIKCKRPVSWRGETLTVSGAKSRAFQFIQS
jgi:hypothetical protein